MSSSTALVVVAATPEDEVFAAARQSILVVKRLFEEHWLVIGQAVVLARKIANDQGVRFMDVLQEKGLGAIAKPATASRLEQIMANLPAVMEWRAGLSDQQRIDWASPTSVMNRCPALVKEKHKDKVEREAPPIITEDAAELVHQNEALERKVKRLESNDIFREEDSGETIGRKIFDKLIDQRNGKVKIQAVIHTLTKLLEGNL